MQHIVFTSLQKDIVLLLVRLVVGIAFLMETYLKAKDIKKFAKNDGLSVPIAKGIALCEFLAGISLLSGILAQLAAVGVILLMASTTGLHIVKWHSPYRAARGGWEYDVTLLVLAAVVLVFGAGMFVLF